MSVRLRELLEKRNKIVQRSREIIDAAEKENRAMSDEEQKNFDKAMSDQEALGKTIEAEQRLADVEGQLARTHGTPLNNNQGGRSNSEGNGGGAEVRTIGTGRYAVQIDQLESRDAEIAERRSSPEYRAAYARYLRAGEMRALDAGSTGQNGAFLVTPVQMAQGILQALDNAVFIRGLATVFSIPTATSLGRVSLESDPDDADWTSELATGDEEASMAFGKRELTPHPLAKLITISNKLLRQSTIDVEGLVRQRMAYKFSLPEENAFLTGDGVQKPLGIFTASNDGVPTSRDIATGNTSTGITFEGLISAKYGLKAGYLAKARWLFGRTAITQIAKLRDDSGASPGTGQFLWQPSQQLGEPDRIHGIPVMMSEYVPATFTTGLYVGAIADFSFYHIADALDMQIQRLVELYARSNQTGLIMGKETDGMPVLAEAFVRVKLG